MCLLALVAGPLGLTDTCSRPVRLAEEQVRVSQSSAKSVGIGEIP